MSRKLFREGGFNIRKFASNSDRLNITAAKDGVWDYSEQVKVLGYYWAPTTDMITLQEPKSINVYTKRGVLKWTNSIFDPYGFLGPMEIRARGFIRKLWQQKRDWDESFAKNSALMGEWEDIKREISACLGVKINRRLNIKENSHLHILSDASKDAFGSVAYLVTPTTESSPATSQIIVSKSKLTKKLPQGETIPKLELDGLNLSTVIIAHFRIAFSHLVFEKQALWSDSQNGLATFWYVLHFSGPWKKCLQWYQMGSGYFFPTNPDLADILGSMDLNFHFLDFLEPIFLDFQVPRSQNSKISGFPGSHPALSGW